MFKYIAGFLAAGVILAGSVCTPCLAGDMRFSIDVGYSKYVGDDSKYWNAGFAISGNAFLAVTQNILIGGHLSCHRWTPEGNPDLVGANWIPHGSALLFDVHPSVRLTTSIERSRLINAFIQVGAGASIIDNNATLHIVPVVPGDPTGWYADLMTSQVRPGLSMGAGITSMNRGNVRFEIIPMYNVVFTSDKYTRYISVNAGVSVGM